MFEFIQNLCIGLERVIKNHAFEVFQTEGPKFPNNVSPPSNLVLLTMRELLSSFLFQFKIIQCQIIIGNFLVRYE